MTKVLVTGAPGNVAACILFMVCQPKESVIQELIVTPMTATAYP